MPLPQRQRHQPAGCWLWAGLPSTMPRCRAMSRARHRQPPAFAARRPHSMSRRHRAGASSRYAFSRSTGPCRKSGSWPLCGLARLVLPETRVGRQAGEQAFKRDAPRYRVLHLATHGFFLDGTCLPASSATTTRGAGGLAVAAHCRESAAPFRPRVGGSEPSRASPRGRRRWHPHRGRSRVAGSPRRRVGRALRVRHRRRRDQGGGRGVRTAPRVPGGRRPHRGDEPVVGRGSIHSRLDAALYEGRFERHLSTADAVHQASLTVLRDRRAKGQSTHPFFWAAFVAAGDWR